MDAWNALELYRMKDVVEKAFGNLKERLNLRRTLVSSEQSLDGKLFVEFVALIYLSYIHRRMLDQSLHGNQFRGILSHKLYLCVYGNQKMPKSGSKCPCFNEIVAL